MINNMTKIIVILLYYSQVLPGYDCRYSVVVDGGSTGTRMHIFNFNEQEVMPTLNNTTELKYKVKLSSFSDNRHNWGLLNILLNNLTSEASSRIPEISDTPTPFYIEATSGVRQLPSLPGARILQQIKQELSRSNFVLKNDSVNILTANEEGKYAWITVNFLLGKLTFDGREKMNTYGVMDLGGSSTQIAFVTNKSGVVTENTTIHSQVYKLYSRGYDRMGINEIRLKFFGAEECSRINCSGRFFIAACIHIRSNFTYRYKGITFNISGYKSPSGSDAWEKYQNCLVRAFNVSRLISFEPVYLNSTKFIAINSFYNILNKVNPIFLENSLLNLKEVSMRKIYDATTDYCSHLGGNAYENSLNHFLCMDFQYVFRLFYYTYGFPLEQKIIFANEIHNRNLSWALGFAISKL